VRFPGVQNPKSKIQNVRAVLFDFGGTLDADGVTWRERFFRLWRAEGEDIARDRFDRAFYAADDALVGTLSPTLPLADTVGRLARGIGKGLGTADAALPGRIAERFYRDARERLQSSAQLFERLSLRYRLGVVSNFYGNLAAVCREAGIGSFLSAAVDSAVVGHSKPHAAIFQAALARLQVEPLKSLFVGDSPERDMVGARGVGMRHVLLSECPEEANGCCCPHDLVIRRLAELEALL
jgi:putative hydrolase of the HAD superfamily